MSNEQNNVPIDPLIAKTFYQNQHELTIDADAAADAASTVAAMDPEKWQAVGIDEETARKVAGCVTNSLLSTPGSTKKFSDVISDTRLYGVKQAEKRAIKGAEQPAIPRSYKPLGKPKVSHITQEQLRIEMGLNGNRSKAPEIEQQVA